MAARCWSWRCARPATSRKARAATAELRALGSPIADVVAPHPFVGWQQAFDPLLDAGRPQLLEEPRLRRRFRTARSTRWSKRGEELPGPECEVFIAHVGGAMSRVPATATAFPQRNAHFIMNVHTRWRDPARTQSASAGREACSTDAASFALGSAYVNFMPGDEGGPDRAGLRTELSTPCRNQARVTIRATCSDRTRTSRRARPDRGPHGHLPACGAAALVVAALSSTAIRADAAERVRLLRTVHKEEERCRQTSKK